MKRLAHIEHLTVCISVSITMTACSGPNASDSRIAAEAAIREADAASLRAIAAKQIDDRGKFVVVWKKQADGAWKIVADIWNSDMPPAPAPKP